MNIGDTIQDTFHYGQIQQKGYLADVLLSFRVTNIKIRANTHCMFN